MARDITERSRLLAEAREHAANTEKLSDVGARRRLHAGPRSDRAESHRHRDGTRPDAEFGAFFYNVTDPDSGNAYMLYTLSGASREAFATFPQPRATAVFAPTFYGDGPVRLDDVTQDPRYGKNAPYFGMPPGHLAGPQLPRGPREGCRRGRARRLVLRALRGWCVHRAARAAGARRGGMGLGGAAERATVRGCSGGEPHEGRVPRRPLPRAAHAAQRHRRLLATAARRHAVGREGHPRPRDARAECHVADADRGGRARRLADRVRQDSARRAAGGTAGHRRQRGGHDSSRPPTPRACAFRR